MELYFYNIKDQKVLSAVPIPGVASLGTGTCIVEPAHCGPQGGRSLLPKVRVLATLPALPGPEGAGPGPAQPCVFGFSAAPRLGFCTGPHRHPQSLFGNIPFLLSHIFSFKNLCFCFQSQRKISCGGGAFAWQQLALVGRGLSSPPPTQHRGWEGSTGAGSRAIAPFSGSGEAWLAAGCPAP